jgi:hypothetical protein
MAAVGCPPRCSLRRCGRVVHHAARGRYGPPVGQPHREGLCGVAFHPLLFHALLLSPRPFFALSLPHTHLLKGAHRNNAAEAAAVLAGRAAGGAVMVVALDDGRCDDARRCDDQFGMQVA